MQRIRGAFLSMIGRNRRIIVCCCLWTVVLTVTAQRKQEDFIPKSPEAAAFDKVTDIPVSMYSGRLNLSIPLYTLTSGDLSLPISLDYQGSAISVEQEATWVGLNWLLNVGGVILTRAAAHSNVGGYYQSPGDWKKDWEHMFNDLPFRPAYPDGGEFGIQYKLDAPQPSRGGYGGNWFDIRWDIYENRNSYSDLSNRLYDEILNYHNGEAQVYHAVFLGNSITFVWDKFKDEFFITGNKKNFKIIGTPGDHITITDGHGIEYDFRLLEKTYPQGDNVDMNHVTYDGTFYLMGIKSPTGHAISLNYANEGVYWPVRHVHETLYDSSYPVEIPFSVVSTDYLFQAVNNNLKLVRTLSPYYILNKKRLLSITADSLTIIFNANTPRKDLDVKTNTVGNHSESSVNRLDNIEIAKREAGKIVLIKKLNFDYSYFTKNERGGNTLKDYWKDQATDDVYFDRYSNDDFLYLRLRLDKMWESAADGSAKPPYQFDYFCNVDKFGSLPGKNSASQDYWGYYNGRENYNTKYHTMLPKSYGNTYDDVCSFKDTTKYLDLRGADRRSDCRYAVAGMLTSVKYPTGADANFAYEQNTFNNCNYVTACASEDPDDYYFNKMVVAYEPTNAKDLDIKTSDHEYTEPVYQRAVNDKEFTLSSSSTINWETTYTKNNSNVSWKLLYDTKVILYTYITTTDKNGKQQETVIKTDSICCYPKDTVASRTTVTYTKKLNLVAGKYRLSMRILPQNTEGHDYKSITSKLLSTQGYFGYKTKTTKSIEGFEKNEPTLGDTTSISYEAKKNVMTYDCNQINYSRPDCNRHSQLFLIERPCRVDINACYSKNSYSGATWKTLMQHPVLLYKYGVVETQDSKVETIAGSTSYPIHPSDTVHAGGSLNYHKSVLLAPGRYEIHIPPFNETDNVPEFYETTGEVSLNITNAQKIYYGNGVRVKSVIRKDNGKDEKTKYCYDDIPSCKTFGKLMAPPVFSREKLVIYQNSTLLGEDVSEAKAINYTIVSSDDLNPNSPFTGYSQVSLTQTGSDAMQHGEHKYKFWNKIWGDGISWNFTKKAEDPRNGNVLGDSLFDNEGKLKYASSTTYQIKKMESRMLSAAIENLYVGPHYYTNPVNIWRLAANGGIMDICLYSSVQFATTAIKTKSITKEDTGSMAEEKETVFNTGNCQPQREKVSTSRKGEYEITDRLYPNDYSGLAWVDTLKVKNITDNPLQVVHSLYTAKGSYLTGSSLMKYNGGGQPTALYSKEMNGQTSVSSFLPSNKNGFNTNGYYADQTITYDDVSHNPRMTTDRYSKNTVYVWGYKNKYPIAVIQGATPNQVLPLLGGTSQLESAAIPLFTAAQLHQKLSSISGALVTTYGYAPYVGMTCCVNPNGETVYYEYDSFLRLKKTSDNLGVHNQFYYNMKR